MIISATAEKKRAGTARELVDAVPVHRAFADVALRQPGASALVEESGRRWSYRELSCWATVIAARLREAGAGPGRAVALRLPRSARLVASLLAVFETGAAAVVLDPRTPADRLAAVEADAGCTAVVVPSGEPAGEDRVHGPAPVAVAGLPEAAGAPLLAAGPDGEGDRVACVFYTSGSTGRPKGVQVTHRNLGRFAADPCWDGPGHRVTALVSALGFDALSYDLWVPLTRGGTVVVPDEDRVDAHRLAGLVAAHGVTGVFLTTAWFGQIAVDAPGTLRGLHTVLTGGEAADPRAFALVRAACPQVVLGHVYGPTECTTFTTRHLLAPGEPLPGGRVPIGTGLPGVEVRLLGPDLAEVADGEPGEVYVAGEQVALGYLNQPARTAERFVADPHGPAGARMYRTGDLAVRGPGGALEYLRRDDDQVKIRGHRVEPGEVRAALAALPGVARAAVVVRDGRLAGYAVPEAGRAVTADELRAELARVLPEYMVPSVVVLLDALPLTVNGKVDRAALPAPAAVRAGAGVPRTAAEKALCTAFAELLGLAAVGTDDDFFVLGGDSIVAMRLVSRVRGENVAISSQDVFRLRTPGALAAAAQASAPSADLLHLSATGRLELQPIALWLREQGEGTDEFVQSVLVETPPGLARQQLVAGLQTVLDRHDALRTRLPDPFAEAVWQPEVPAPGEVDAARLLDTVDLRELPDAPSAAEVRAEVLRVMRSLDLPSGHLLRAVWWDRGPGRPGRLLLAVHHLVIDGVSWQVLLPDLARATEDPRALGAWGASTAYRQWVRQHNARAASPRVLATLPHWRAASLPAPAPWPTGEPLNAALDTIATSRTLESVLPPEVGRALLTRAPAYFGATTQELLLTALAVASARRLTHPGAGHRGARPPRHRSDRHRHRPGRHRHRPGRRRPRHGRRHLRHGRLVHLPVPPPAGMPRAGGPPRVRPPRGRGGAGRGRTSDQPAVAGTARGSFLLRPAAPPPPADRRAPRLGPGPAAALQLPGPLRHAGPQPVAVRRGGARTRHPPGRAAAAVAPAGGQRGHRRTIRRAPAHGRLALVGPTARRRGRGGPGTGVGGGAGRVRPGLGHRPGRSGRAAGSARAAPGGAVAVLTAAGGAALPRPPGGRRARPVPRPDPGGPGRAGGRGGTARGAGRPHGPAPGAAGRLPVELPGAGGADGARRGGGPAAGGRPVPPTGPGA